MPDIPKVFLFVPFPYDLVWNAQEDYFDFFTAYMIEAFKTKSNIKYLSCKSNWGENKPNNSEGFETKIEANPMLTDIWASGSNGTLRESKYLLKPFKKTKHGCLAGVKPIDMLFIIGHSSFEGGWISLKKKGEQKIIYYKIRVDFLADLLEVEGLNKKHRHIKLNSCYGGGSDAIDRSIARDLAIQLKKKGYLNLTVGGYQYLVEIDSGNKNMNLAAPMEEEYQDLIETNPSNHPIDLVAPMEEGYSIGIYTIRYTKLPVGSPLTEVFAPKNNPCLDELMYELDPYRCWYNGKGECIRWNVPKEYFEESKNVFGTQTKIHQAYLHYPDGTIFEAYKKRKADEAEWVKTMERVNQQRSH